MSLSDFDRKPKANWYEPWGREVTMRPIGATELLRLNGLHNQVHGQDGGTEGLVKFYSELLAIVVVDPAAPVAEWSECKLETLTELGTMALGVCGLVEEDTKKN